MITVQFILSDNRTSKTIVPRIRED